MFVGSMPELPMAPWHLLTSDATKLEALNAFDQKIMTAPIAEFIGTAFLVTFGNGVVANVVLSRTKGNNSGWIVITAGWALAVFVGVFSSQAASGAHLNPAVTLAMAQSRKFAWASVPRYIPAQLLGGIAGGAL